MQGILDKFNAANTKEARENALQTAGEFLNDRVTAIQQKRDQLLGSMSPNTSLLTQASQNTLKSLYKRAGRGSPDLAPVGSTLGYVPVAGDALKTSPGVASSGSALDAIMSQYGGR
jgi:hypothetical protein